MWSAYQPCDCPGPCTSDCPCLVNKHYCEKFCACYGQCTKNAWPGCVCVAKEKCRTKNCKCYAASRECDPDVCKGCGPTCLGTAAPGTECHNMRLRLRQHKRVVMGLSNVQGWGAFVLVRGFVCCEGSKQATLSLWSSSSLVPQEPVRKGDYIGEYTGELLGHAEADRRGKVCHKYTSLPAPPHIVCYTVLRPG